MGLKPGLHRLQPGNPVHRTDQRFAELGTDGGCCSGITAGLRADAPPLFDLDRFAQLRQPAITDQLGPQAGALSDRHLGIGGSDELTGRQPQDGITEKLQLFVMGMQATGGVGEGFLKTLSLFCGQGRPREAELISQGVPACRCTRGVINAGQGWTRIAVASALGPIPSRMSSQRHDLALDALRGLAALVVVISHFICAFQPELMSGLYPDLFPFAASSMPWLLWLQHPPMSLVFNGHFAVCIFFVLSGYVLALPFFAGQSQRLRERLAGRYLRLNLPIAGVMLLSYGLWRAGWYWNEPAARLSDSQWFGLWFQELPDWGSLLRAMVYGGVIQGDSLLIPPLWTLKIEFIGSLVLLGFLLVVSPRGQCRAWPVLLVLLVLIFGWETPYYVLFVVGANLRPWCSGSGWIARHRTVLIGLAGLGLGSIHPGALNDLLVSLGCPGEWVLALQRQVWHGLGAVLLVWSVISGWGRPCLSQLALVRLGRWSFGLYLIHFSVLCTIAAWLSVHWPGWTLPLQFVIYLGASLGGAWLIAHSLDRWGMKAGHRFAAIVTRQG